MPQYKPYAKVKDTPSRKSRKGDRNKTFLLNKLASKLQRKTRKEAREARLAAQAAVDEELEESVQ